MKRVLLFGGSGQLGSAILERWSTQDVTAPTSSEVDVCNADSVAATIADCAPDIVVNCTAYNRVDDAERNPEPAFAVNAFAVESMARACAQVDCEFLTVSTDYVFDGKAGRPYVETDEARPINAYGISKLAGELLAMHRGSKAFVVRTCGVFGTRVSTSKGHTFIDRVLQRAAAGEALQLVSDQIVSPTFAPHLADALGAIISSGKYGLYHAANEGALSWYEFALEAFRQAGLAPKVEAVSSATWKAAARRPAFSALENRRLHELGVRMPTLAEAVAAYLATRSASGVSEPGP